MIRDKGFKVQNNELQAFSPQGAGNISVNLYKNEQGKFRIRVCVTGGQANHAAMRAGLAAVIIPEHFSSARALKDGVGRMAALLAKQLEKAGRKDFNKYRPCIDEVDAYKGAVEMLDEAMMAAHSEGII